MGLRAREQDEIAKIGNCQNLKCYETKLLKPNVSRIDSLPGRTMRSC